MGIQTASNQKASEAGHGLAVSSPAFSAGRAARNLLRWPLGSQIVSGHAAVLAHEGLLRELAELNGAAGAADDLAYFLARPDAEKKIPLLVLERARPGEDCAGGYKEATFLFEYRNPLGRPAGVFSTSDGSGRRNLLAAPANRARTAARAARVLIDRGAHIVHIAWQPDAAHRFLAGDIAGEMHAGPASGTMGQRLWSLREFEAPLYLPLAETFDRTLARIGQRTRYNLRYYRRRAVRELGCHFVAEISPAQMPIERFVDFNRHCMFPVSDQEARQRYKAMAIVRRPLFCGIRDRNGEWLSLAGGRRRPDEVEIDWQMNRNDLPNSSLCIVLRSFLIQHEVEHGTRRFYIEGGTPHPIGRSFALEPIAELTVRRRSAYASLLRHVAARAYKQKNYLAQILRDREQTWHPW